MSRSMRSDRIKLEDVSTLTFFADKHTTHRRKAAVPQLTCQGKACKLYQPDVIQCSNVGGSPPDWACNAELPDFLRMGRVEVSCENWSDSPTETHVLKGSCGLDYRLIDLGSPSRIERGSSSWSPIPLLAILLGLFILYKWYKAATDPAQPNNGAPRGPGGGGPPWNPFNRPDNDDDDPPPPYPKGGATAQRAAPIQQGRGPGFWTGLAGGAAGAFAANQLFGGGAQTRQEQRYRGYQAADPLVRGRRDDRGEGPSGFGGLGGGSGAMRSSTGHGRSLRRSDEAAVSLDPPFAAARGRRSPRRSAPSSGLLPTKRNHESSIAEGTDALAAKQPTGGEKAEHNDNPCDIENAESRSYRPTRRKRVNVVELPADLKAICDAMDGEALLKALSKPGVTRDGDAILRAVTTAVIATTSCAFSSLPMTVLRPLSVEGELDVREARRLAGEEEGAKAFETYAVYNDKVGATANISNETGNRMLINAYLLAAIDLATMNYELAPDNIMVHPVDSSSHSFAGKALAVFPEVEIPAHRLVSPLNDEPLLTMHGTVDYLIVEVQKRNFRLLTSGGCPYSLFDSALTLVEPKSDRTLGHDDSGAQMMAQCLSLRAYTVRHFFAGVLTNGRLWRFYITSAGDNPTDFFCYTTQTFMTTDPKDENLIVSILAEMMLYPDSIPPLLQIPA